MKWDDNGRNQVLRKRGFFISFNPDTNSSEIGKAMTAMGNLLGEMLGESLGFRDGPETALVKKGFKSKQTFYILEGDFRKDYEALVDKGFKACYKFYLSKKDEHGSNWSTR